MHDTNLKGNPSRIRAEGKRFTVLHAGCNSGFLEGCSLILDNDTQHKDYHKNMNGEIFKNWVEQQLVPALNTISGRSIVIRDNAPYHSMRTDKRLNSNSRKAEMVDWLQQKNITYDSKVTKKYFGNVIKPILGEDCNKKYIIDNILSSHGHQVLRLPPYHCQ